MQQFGRHVIQAAEIFYHVLVIPQRLVRRLAELTEAEISDLFLTTQHVGRIVEREYGGTSLTVAIQDGPEAGQSIEVSAHMAFSLLILGVACARAHLAQEAGRLCA